MSPADHSTGSNVDTVAVLYVGGEHGSTGRIAESLQREDDRLAVTTEHSTTAGLAHLDEHDVDCVVSEYDVPARTGLEFLSDVRDQYPRLPFILVTDDGSEELASEAIAAGVSDYVPKDGAESYGSLATRIVSGVREFEGRSAEKRAKEDAQRLLERTADAFARLDTDWRFTYVNGGAESVFDRPASELLGNSLWEMFPEATETPFYDQYREAMAEGEPRTIEEYFEPRDRWYREHLYPSEDGISVVFRDITDQKERERELEEAKSHLEDAVEAGAIGTWEWHIPEDRFVASPAFARKFDVDPEAAREGVPLERFASAVHEDDRERVERKIAGAIDECGEYEAEYRVRNADGELRWVLAQGHVECDEDGTAVRLPGALVDITERKRTERESRRSRAFLEESTDIVSVLEEDGTFDYVSPSVERILGYAPEELIGTNGFDRLHPDDRDDLWETFEELLDDAETSVRVEGRFRHANGEWRWLELHASNQLDDPVINGVVVNSRDITERKKQQRKHRLTIDRMTEAVIELDEDWRFTEVNERAEEMYGRPAGELLGRNVWDAFPETVGTRFYEEYHRVMTTGEPTTFEEYYERPDRWFQVHVYPSLEGGLSVYFRDITELKQRERELRQRYTELTQLNQFNELVQNLVQTLVTESTRTEIEQTVCEQLAASDFYQVAWVGERQTAATVEPRVSAGVDLAAVRHSAVDDAPRGIPERAAETRSVCVARGDDPLLDATPGSLEPTDVEAALAAPIEYEDALYGVVVVYTARPEMFDDRQREIFGDLGETIGFAITAVERKDALAADTVLELTLTVRDPDQFFIHAATQLETTLSLAGITKRGETEYLEYFTVADASPDRIRELADRFDGLDHLRIVNEQDRECLCEVRTDESSIVSTVAELGGTVTDMGAEQRHGTVSVELPQTAEVGRVVGALEATADSVELETKRTVDRPIRSESRFRSTVTDRLTDKQRDTLEAAYLAGYFEHPRFSTGEEVAESLGISPSTFHQHVRVGLDKLLAVLVETSAGNQR